jgi:general stress protein YciG
MGETEMSIKLRGFGSMDKVRQRELASRGGKAAHRLGVAHQWTVDEAREAGRKGGLGRKAKAVRLADLQDGDGQDY